ncbi:hypothetical protein [Clostridium transplantifaecale]|uniref:hypothetical protein n=1 Tax=Clostridium transplantifaecale TaxID=2479838 RepID=UPI001FAA6278|nr:hypothetical protein [Clostridium transplantifaecale]
MKDAILEKGESWYTNMADVFRALDGAPAMYNWLITDILVSGRTRLPCSIPWQRWK